MSSSITITQPSDPALVLVAVESAQLDETLAQAMFDQVLAAAEKSPTLPILLDLSRVAIMPSMSIGALMTLWKKLHERKQRLMLIGLQPPVRNTLAICRLDKFFEFCDTAEEARLRIRNHTDHS